MQVTGARVICVRVCGNVQEEMCAERAYSVCGTCLWHVWAVYVACVGCVCGRCEVAYGVRVICTLCGMHLSG